MELDGIELEEIKPFYDSLAVEKDQLRFPLEEILKSKFIKGVRVDGKLAGIGGITLSYRLFPFCFWVVKSEFQRKGVGYEIAQGIISFARDKHSFLMLTASKGNTPAINLYRKSGFRIIYRLDDIYWMFFPLNKRGGIIGRSYL
ncbi:MAG: hypothetical protein DDT40_01611 [candidate division WS2 bacterium]|nr:hypothetical protein [Candidatus Psychracetigena formicireducens]